MEDTITEVFLWGLLPLAPVILVCLVGLAVTIRFRHKAIHASRWAAGALCLALASCGFLVFAIWVRTWLWFIFWPVPMAAGFLLLIIGLYSGRPNRLVTDTGEPEMLWQPVVTVFRARPGLKSMFMMSSIGVFLLVSLISCLMAFILPESYVGTARIKLETGTTNGLAAAPGLDALSPRYLQTECKVIESEVVLGQVIERLNLNRAWARRYGGGGFVLKTAESLAVLKARMSVEPVEHTSLIKIRVYSDRPDEPAQLANEIAQTYQAYRDRKPAALAPAMMLSHVKKAPAPIPSQIPIQNPQSIINGLFGRTGRRLGTAWSTTSALTGVLSSRLVRAR